MGNLCTNRQSKVVTPNSQTPYNSRRPNTSETFKSGQYQSKNAIQKLDSELMNNFNIDHPSVKFQNDLLQAKSQGDINVLIKYLENDSQPATQIDMGHPWAKSPTSIGSIATMYLCILFMKEIKENEEGFKQQQNKILQCHKILIDKNVSAILNNNLNHKDQDRVQITILLLVYLVDFQQMQEDLLKANIFDSMLPYIYKKPSNNINQRIASAYILRELYKDRQQYVKIILNDKESMESIQDFITQQNSQYVIEGLDSCDDLTTDSNCYQNVNKETCQVLYDSGFYSSLQNSLQYFHNLDTQNYTQDQQEVYSLILELLKCLMTKLFNAHKES